MRRDSVVAIILMLALAGCVAGVPTARLTPEAGAVVGHPAKLVDARGDAFERAAPFVPGSVMQGAYAPYFDILEAGYDGETPGALLFSITLARLTAGFPELDGAQGFHRVANYEVCYGPHENNSDRRCADLQVATSGTNVMLQGTFTLSSPRCNEWALCAWPIPVEIEYGEPGIIHFTVPKAMATWDEQPPHIAWLRAADTWGEANPATPTWHAAYSINSPQGNYHHHVGAGEDGDVPDPTNVSRVDTTFVPAPFGSNIPSPPGGHAVMLPVGNMFGARSRFDLPSLDLLSVDLREENGDLVTRWTVRDLPHVPDDNFLFIVEIGVAGKEVYEMGFIKEPNHGAYGYAGHCISYECAGDFGGSHAEHDMSHQFSTVVPFTVTTGSPGHVETRAPLSTFPSIVKGDRTNLILTASMYSDASAWAGQYGDPLRADAHKMSFVDFRLGGEPHVFTDGNAPSGETHHHEGVSPFSDIAPHSWAGR